MKYGNVTGVSKPISRLVQGTGSYNPANPDGMVESLDLALETGFNTFDTAQVYGAERERVFGRWIRDRGIRDKVNILAKGAHHSDRPRVTPEDITTDLTNTLEHMQVDFVELYLLHRDNPAVPVGPIVEILNEHHKAGRIGAFGGSNWTAQRIEEANQYAKAHGLIPFAVSSPNFSLAEQVEEPWDNCVSIGGPKGQADCEYYSKENLALFTWSSLAGGFWSDRYNRDSPREGIDYRPGLVMRCYAYEQNFQRLDRVREMAKERGVTVPQIALAYVMNQPLNIFALVFCANRAEYQANNDALSIALTPQEMAWLDLRAETPR